MCGDDAIRMAALEERVSALEDYRAVLETLRNYSRALDLGQESEWLECFTEDARFEVRSPLAGYPPPRVWKGRARLEEFVNAHSKPPAAYHKHVYAMADIAVDGESANASGYVLHLVGSESGPVMQAYGRYLDSLARGADGRWRIAERVAEIESSDMQQR